MQLTGETNNEATLDIDDVSIAFADGAQEAIFTCKFAGCSRQYASTDGQLSPPLVTIVPLLVASCC